LADIKALIAPNSFDNLDCDCPECTAYYAVNEETENNNNENEKERSNEFNNDTPNETSSNSESDTPRSKNEISTSEESKHISDEVGTSGSNSSNWESISESEIPPLCLDEAKDVTFRPPLAKRPWDRECKVIRDDQGLLDIAFASCGNTSKTLFYITQLKSDVETLTRYPSLEAAYEDPDSLMHNLRSLTLGSSPPINSMPPQIIWFTRLTSLEVGNIQFARAPDTIFSLTNLRKLTLGPPGLGWTNRDWGHLKEIPETLGHLVDLEELTLQSNKIERMPRSLSTMTNLRRLQLKSNELKWLPSLARLTNLEALDLSWNELTEIEPAIGSLTKLRELKLNDNQLRDLPLEFCSLTSVTELMLERNAWCGGYHNNDNIRIIGIFVQFDNLITYFQCSETAVPWTISMHRELPALSRQTTNYVYVNI
jgi:hypothetical protein